MNNINIKKFDIILVFKNYRCIQFIFELQKKTSSKKLKVGFVDLTKSKNNFFKNRVIEKLLKKMNFIKLEKKQNIQFISQKLIVCWGDYDDDQINYIKKIKSKKKYLFCGLLNHSDIYFKFKDQNFDFEKCVYLNNYLYNFRFNKLPNFKKLGKEKLLFGNINYSKNKFLGENINADYIISYPTYFSFSNKFSKIIFLKNILKIINKTNKNEKILIKSHNSENDIFYLIDSKIYKYFFNIFQFFFIKKISLFFWRKFKINFFKKIYLNLKILELQKKILIRTTDLKKICEFNFLSLEIFLPYIKKGLITGQSNSIWHGLSASLKVYNCSQDFYKNDNFKNYNLKIHKHFMEFLDLNNCHGDINYNCNTQMKKILSLNEKKSFLDIL
jgi:hypothetical protein